MKNIDFHFTKPYKTSLFSLLIRAVEKTKYSHVAVEIESNTLGIPIFFEASGTQLKFVCENVFDNKNKIIKTFSLPIDKHEYEEIMAYFLENTGKSYGFKQLIGITWVRIMKEWFKITIKNPYRDGRRTQICSEVAGRILNNVLALKIPLDLDTAGPKDIYKALEKFTDGQRSDKNNSK